MKKGFRLFGNKDKDIDLQDEYYEDEYYEDEGEYEDYEEDSDENSEEDYDREEYDEDYEDEEFSQEELEEYYEKSGMRNPENSAEDDKNQDREKFPHHKIMLIKDLPKKSEDNVPKEEDYEFSDEDYLDDEEEYADAEDRDYPEDEDELDYREEAEDYEEDYGEDDVDYYAEDDDYDPEYEDEDYDSDRDYHRRNHAGKRRKSSQNRENKAALALMWLGDVIKNSSAVERIAAVFAILLITGGIVTATLYAKAMNKNDELGAFSEIGSSMSEIQVVGQSGLIAIADAQRAKMMAAELVSQEEEQQEQEEEVQEVKTTDVKVTLTSIKSDIKVKFMDSASGKLIANVPFEIKVVTPDGTTVSYDDHDRDGIIYKTKLTAGTYKVTPQKLPDAYSDYILSLETLTIKVKDTVEMKAVDVKNEIKDESQINVAKEEAKGGQETESELTDTVDWDGESWVKDGDGDGSVSYQEVKKADVPEPSGSSKVTIGTTKRFAEPGLSESASEELTSEEQPEEPGEDDPGNDAPIDVDVLKELTIEKTSFTLEVGETDTIRVEADSTVYFETSDSSVVFVDDRGRITGAGEGSATITLSAEGYNSATVSVTVKKKEEEVIEPGRIPLEETSFTLYVNDTARIVCTDDSINCKFSSDNEAVATVGKKGKITAVSVGTAIITVSAKNYEDATVTVTVTKNTEKGVVPIEITSLTMYEGQTKKIKSKEKGIKLSFATSDKEIAKVSEEGVITAVSKGSAKITVSAEGCEDAVIDVTVTHMELKDKEGNTLYVMETDGNYRVATYADYEKYKVFYKKIEKKNKIYHGWATIDGKTYFFDNSGNYVTGEQVINHVKYTFGSDGVLAKSAPTVGIDVSKHNGSIDWKAVKNSGVNFAIIRCGYRGYSTGVMVEDPTFRTNIKGALAAGLRVGVYYYSQAVDEVEAVEEASMVINLLSGYGIQLPVYMDVEASGGRGDGISVSQRTANIRAFCGTIQSAGYKAGVYANKTWLNSKINAGSISNYNIWLAQYAKEHTYNTTRVDMWQYTSKGRVSGISGNVDMNICY